MAYLNTEQAAFRFGFVKREIDAAGRAIEVPDLIALRAHIHACKVPTRYAGRMLRVREEDMERSLRPGRHVFPQPTRRSA
jgi:hypothetical protein